MRLFHAVSAVQLLAGCLVTAAPLDSSSTLAIDIDPAVSPIDALAYLQQQVYATLEQSDAVEKRSSNSRNAPPLKAPRVPEGCSLANASIRKDW